MKPVCAVCMFCDEDKRKRAQGLHNKFMYSFNT